MIELHINDTIASERQKYTAMWEQPAYHEFSPGKELVKHFMKIVQPPPRSSLIDIGCGDGIAGLEFAKLGLQVTYLDLIDVLRPEVDRGRFIEAPIWSFWHRHRSLGWDYGYCVDVLEHLPKEYTMLSVERIVRACRLAWLAIALVPDVHGATIGEQLHLTIESFEWWRDRIASIGKLIEARDFCGRGLYVVAK